MDLTNEKDKMLLNKMSTYKIKIPDIKRVKIDKLTNDNELVRDFIEHCMPTNLHYLCLNRSYNELVKANYYN